MADPSDPPRKFYDFKAREFERVNAPPVPPPADTPPAPAPDPAPVQSGPIDVKEMFQQAQLRGPLLRSGATRDKAANARTDVTDILEANHARAKAAGGFDVSYAPKPPSRRKRDYWRLMAIGTIFLGSMTVYTGIAVLGGNRGAAIPFVYSAAGVVMYNAALWWVMWHIMEDY